MSGPSTSDALRPYLPTALVRWHAHHADVDHRQVEASLVFADISGFTNLSERLARKGKVGAEELSDVMDRCFEKLLAVGYQRGGRLIKFGGDALLLLFVGEAHEARAASSAYGMRAELAEQGRFRTSAGRVQLHMSAGVASGRFHFFLVGTSHRELVLTGPGATEIERLEASAQAGEIVISSRTASALPAAIVGPARGPGFVLAGDVSGVVAQPIEPRFMSSGLEQFVPVGLRDFLLSGIHDPEHRQATVAFLHFTGVDELMESAGPAIVAKALNELVTDVQQAVDERGVTFLGTDVYHDGGKILLVAGAPRTTGSDEELMLLGLREIMARDRTLPVRVGVHRGHVFAGDIGPFYRRTYTVMGDAVNLAARLMARAAAGQIVATGEVLGGSRTAFEAEALEPFHVKGKTDLIEAFVVGEASGTRSAADVGIPLIGREAEMRRLLAALADARAGNGRVVEIVAEEGLGKSRLVREFEAEARDAIVLSAACQLYEASTPYAPFRSLLRRLLGLSDEVDGELARRRLADLVVLNAPELAAWLPLLAVPFGVEMADTPETARLDEAFRKPRLEEVTVRLLEVLLPVATVLAFEDVHWMDAASADLLARLATATPDRPWVVCVTRRAADSAFVAPDGARTQRLELPPLDGAHAAALLDAATAASPLARHVVELMAERAGGHPLFLLELVKGGGASDVESLPDSVEALVAARIDQLEPAQRAVLRRASVLGTRFPAGLARAVFDGDSRKEHELFRGLEAFIERTEGGDYQFRHALIRDAAYEGLPYRTRQRLHAVVGDTILDAPGDEPDEQAELLSYHFFDAHRFAEAWRYSIVAAERARTVFANLEAATFYRRALRAGRRLRSLAGEERAGVWEALGDVQFKAGLYADARDSYRSARRLAAGRPVALAQLCQKEVRNAERQGRLSQALRWIGRGHKVLEGIEGNEPARLRTHLTVWRGWVRFLQGGAADAVTWCERAVAQAEAIGDQEALARAYFVLDLANAALGRLESDERSRRALEIYRRLDDLSGQALVYNTLGGHAYWEGRWDEALDLYARGHDARLATGDPVTAAGGTANIAEILVEQGHLAEARNGLEEALLVWRAAGDVFGVAFLRAQLGRVAAREGRFDEAREQLDEARSLFAELGAKADVMETDARIGEVLVFQGRGSEARAYLDRALEQAQSLDDFAVQAPMLYRCRGYAAIQEGDLVAARRELERSLEAARRRRADYEEAVTLGALARLARLGGAVLPPEDVDRSSKILTRLGVVAVPAVPLVARS